MPPTAADRRAPVSPCAACGVARPAALVAYPEGEAAPLALCRDCARDPAHLRALVRRFRGRPVAVRRGPPPA